MTLNLHKMSVFCYIVNSQYMAKFSFFFVFICGVATAAFVYALLAICRPSVKAILTPYALLPSTHQLVFEELAFGIIDIRPDVDHDLILKPSHALLSAKKNRESENSSAQAEALASLHMALEMKSFGKLDKAVKLFQHALALHPTHPDILNQYGEFLEEKQNDIIKAEHMYTRALTLSPGHSRALSNRKRTLPQVQILDRMLLARIDAKRDQLGQIPEHNSALRRVKKEAYFQHIYHTVAIEGNTMTLSQTRHIVETRMTVAGKSIMEHNEILGLDAALSYINSSLVHRIGAITVDDILEIHKRVLGFVDPVEGGTFRRTQVFVGDHVPPHPSDVRLLMEDFVQWLNSDAALEMHPVKYAALAHYKLVFIHPFIDGNGRTARLLMNLILMQAGFPPVIIRKQDRQLYYDYLETANEGDVRPFIRFIADCTEKTLEVYLFAIKEYPSRDIPALDSVNKMKTIIIEE